MVVKSSTKKRLMELGVPEELAHKLANDANMDAIKQMSTKDVSKKLGLTLEDAKLERTMLIINEFAPSRKVTKSAKAIEDDDIPTGDFNKADDFDKGGEEPARPIACSYCGFEDELIRRMEIEKNFTPHGHESHLNHRTIDLGKEVAAFGADIFVPLMEYYRIATTADEKWSTEISTIARKKKKFYPKNFFIYISEWVNLHDKIPHITPHQARIPTHMQIHEMICNWDDDASWDRPSIPLPNLKFRGRRHRAEGNSVIDAGLLAVGTPIKPYFPHPLTASARTLGDYCARCGTISRVYVEGMEDYNKGIDSAMKEWEKFTEPLIDLYHYIDSNLLKLKNKENRALAKKKREAEEMKRKNEIEKLELKLKKLKDDPKSDSSGDIDTDGVADRDCPACGTSNIIPADACGTCGFAF